MVIGVLNKKSPVNTGRKYIYFQELIYLRNHGKLEQLKDRQCQLRFQL